MGSRISWKLIFRKLCATLSDRACYGVCYVLMKVFFFLSSFSVFQHTSTFQLLDKPWSQVSSLSPPRFLPSFYIAHRVQQSHCSSIFRRVFLTHALALSASQFVHKKKNLTSMHSGGFELTKLAYTRLEDNLIRHRGDRGYRSATPLGTSLYQGQQGDTKAFGV